MRTSSSAAKLSEGARARAARIRERENPMAASLGGRSGATLTASGRAVGWGIGQLIVGASGERCQEFGALPFAMYAAAARYRIAKLSVATSPVLGRGLSEVWAGPSSLLLDFIRPGAVHGTAPG